MTQATVLDAATRAELIAILRATPEKVTAAVAGLNAEQLTTHFVAGEWTVAQNVHHLADSHLVSYGRVKLILTEERPPILPYDPDRFAATAEAQGADLAPSLAILRGLHQRWADLLESLSEEQWRRVGIHPERGETNLMDILRIYARHGDAHIDQIQRTLAAQ